MFMLLFERPTSYTHTKKLIFSAPLSSILKPWYRW